MRIASEIPNYGMSCATDLQHHITTLVGQEVLTKVIETGTYLGLGTTKAVLKGMRIHEMEFDFISIEVNPEHFRQAIANNIGVDGLHLLHGLSIPKSKLPIDTTFNVPDHVIVDHQAPVRAKMYHKEVNFNVDDCLLKRAIDSMGGEPELIILDSAGHIGLIEFKYMMELMNGKEFWLVLDDIGHVKHYESFEIIQSNPEKFDIIWQSDPGEIHRSAIIKVSA